MNSQQMLVIAGSLLLFDLIITIARTGLLNVSQAYLISVHQEDPKKAALTLSLTSKRTQLRATFKIIQSLVRLSIAGALYGSFLNGSMSIYLLFAILALIIWLSEFFIESWILNDPNLWAIRLTPFANILVILLSPIIYIPLALTKKDAPDENPAKITEDELISLVDASEQAGEIEKDESEMIHSVFRFDDTLVREIMVPRVDILTLDANTPIEKAADVVLASGFSRVPVYKNQIDNIIGMLYTKDMLKVWRQGNGIDSLSELLRSAYFIPETKKVDELLDEMQSRRIHIAVVIDEYGGVAGLVTLEDIVEEIFGEIEDEFDEEEEAPYKQISKNEFLFNGNVLLVEVNELLGSRLEVEDTDTIGGLIYARTGHVPGIGESLVENELKITVEQIDDRRILKVRVIKNQDPASLPEIKEDNKDGK
ncbi:MAG: HlyC/CorC family transporter [Chloroflexi bacterium]|nr:HlyC/CorC family transporter [Chloroflexota bacterium]MBT4306721.1 HlyC/CorC family transporter [Chloroflexota bacterium]MBT5336582.1 HlyC/CorC family transporter [Chloroflexota bacterium]MBT6988524.1 HlyC/CorC family transporter [Chloroflexota bacterium]